MSLNIINTAPQITSQIDSKINPQVNSVVNTKINSLPLKLQIIPLGGVEEIGINCTLVRFGQKIIIIDAGLGFSDIDHFGVDYLIPNLEFLKQNKQHIEGLFITHGHLDHIGAIDNFIKELGITDIFAPRFAIELIKNRLEEADIDLEKIHFTPVNENSNLHSEHMKIEYFKVNHSIPDSYGIIVKTPVANIVHTGDFKFDNSPLNEPKADYYKIASFSKEKNLMLLSDSTNSFREGHSVSELVIMNKLEEVISSAKGRVIIATFSSLVTRLYAITKIAKKLNKKIFITGRSMQTSIDIARKLNYINVTDDMFVAPRSLKSVPKDRLIILATGSQGENMSALARMVRGEHREITIEKTDNVILSSSTIPGNDVLVQDLIDNLVRIGAKIFFKDIMNLHTSGHGFIEDQKLMLNLVKPQFFMPVHGYQYFLDKHAQTAVEIGIPKENIVIPQRGDIIEFSNNRWQKVGKITNEPLLVSGFGVGDIGPLVIQDREKLANSGMLVLNIIILKHVDQHLSLLKDPGVYSRGFIFVKDNRELIDQVIAESKKIVESNLKDKTLLNIAEIRKQLEEKLTAGLFESTGREPMIVTNIEVVDVKAIE